jgi:hypothetical protein
MLYKKSTADSQWFLPHKNKKFYQCTTSIGRYISAVCSNITFKECLNKINYCNESKYIISMFIMHGYGDDLVSKYVK